MEDLSGRVAAITGASSGIGKATAILLAKEGCSCAISDINEEGLQQTKQRIEAIGAAVHATVLDVADKDAVYEWADDVVREFGRVNIIVNNAGVGLGAKVEDMTYEDFDWLLGINFYGMVYGTKAFLPYLKQADKGHIVNISSICGIIATPTQSAYASAKFAIKGFTDCLRQELEIDGSGVSATVVHPGGIKTNIAWDARLSPSISDEYGLGKEDIARRFDQIARSTPEKAAERIVDGIKKNKRRVLIGLDAYLIDIVQRLLPAGYQKIMVSFYKPLSKSLQRKSAI